MQGLFNKAQIRPQFSNNWVYSGRGLLSWRHRVSQGCEGGGVGLFTETTVGFYGLRGCSSTLHYKRGKRWQGKIITHLIFTIQPHNLTPCLFVVFVSAFDKMVKTVLCFNKELALPLCSPKNQHFTREEENCIPNRKSLFLPFTMWKIGAEGFLWLQNRLKTVHFLSFFCQLFHMKLL